MGLFYLKKDHQGDEMTKQIKKDAKAKKYEEFTAANIEDAMTKLVKLIANLSTEETSTIVLFKENKEILQEFVSLLVQSVQKR
jgi:uncharacterized protein YbcI